jgi:CRP/FNR family transcriptional regulator
VETLTPYRAPVSFLPNRPVQEFAKGRVIYSALQPCASLYLVILGRVKVSIAVRDGSETIGRIVSKAGIFGESVLIDAPGCSESAVALEKVTLMAWSRKEIEQLAGRDPRLGMAFAQYLVRQCLELQHRMASMAVYKTPERVMLALVELAGAGGSPTADGMIRVASLTHQTLAEYVGTTREIVTSQLNRLRKLGLIRYSRRYMDISVDKIEGRAISAT